MATAGLPCVVKPADDSGSRNVLWCDDLQAAIAHVGKVLAVTRNVRGQPTAGIVIVEELLVGPEYSAEMFGTDDGMRCVGITQRTVSPLPYFVETGHQFPAVVAADVAAEIAEVARQALTATGFRRGPAHVELKLTASGPVVVEINARLAGGMIAELIRLATGVDLLEQQVRAAAGLPVRLEPSRSRRAGIRFLVAAEPGVLAGFSGVAQAERVPGIDRLVVTGVAEREVGPPRDAYDRLGYVIAVGDTSEQVEGALAAAAAAVKISVEKQLVGIDAGGAR